MASARARTAVSVRVGPARFRWVAVHRDYVEGRRFVDEQVEVLPLDPRAPLRAGRSRATRYTDRIELGPAFGRRCGGLRACWRAPVERMLAYRHATLRDDLAAHARHRDGPRLRVAVTGATGLLGTALVPFLTTGGHEVIAVSRRRGLRDAIHWDPAAGVIDHAGLEGLDAVVHLAGETVGTRWSDHRKRRIRNSRVEGTMLLAETLAGLRRPPRPGLRVGHGRLRQPRRRGAHRGRAARGPPADFFVELGRDWESAADPRSPPASGW